MLIEKLKSRSISSDTSSLDSPLRARRMLIDLDENAAQSETAVQMAAERSPCHRSSAATRPAVRYRSICCGSPSYQVV